MQNPIPKRKPDYLLESLDGEMLLYHPKRTAIVRLNDVAALIWRLCDGQRTADDIVTLLCNAFPDADKEIPDETTATLAQFEQQGIIDFV